VIRKYADQTEWGGMTTKCFSVFRKKTIGFSGNIVLVEAVKVKDPLYKSYGKGDYCIVNNGYKWLQHFPENAHFVMTSVYDDRDRIVKRHIDICESHGLTETGIPWYDDLYLDIVIMPGGELFVYGQYLLDEAHAQGLVSDDGYKLALDTANQLMEEYRKGSLDLMLIADKHLAEIYEN
jgi:hypothetical protein